MPGAGGGRGSQMISSALSDQRLQPFFNSLRQRFPNLGGPPQGTPTPTPGATPPPTPSPMSTLQQQLMQGGFNQQNFPAGWAPPNGNGPGFPQGPPPQQGAPTSGATTGTMVNPNQPSPGPGSPFAGPYWNR